MALGLGHWLLRGFGNWALEEKSTGVFVGWCGLWFPEGFPEPEVGWGLMRDKHGRGYATEAAMRARAYAYETLGWKTAISLIGRDNHRSIRVAERLGATLRASLTSVGSIARSIAIRPRETLRSHRTQLHRKEEATCP